MARLKSPEHAECWAHGSAGRSPQHRDHKAHFRRCEQGRLGVRVGRIRSDSFTLLIRGRSRASRLQGVNLGCLRCCELQAALLVSRSTRRRTGCGTPSASASHR